MRKHVAVTVACLLAVNSASAQSVRPDSLLDHMIGSWVLTGKISGKDVVHDVTCRWVLNSEYVEMHEVSRGRTAAGTPDYEAIVHLVHDPHSHVYAAHWLDNTDYNAFLPAGVGRGMAAGDSIPLIFVESPKSSVHTTFVYDRAVDSWAWHMDDVSGKSRKIFARLTMRRSTP